MNDDAAGDIRDIYDFSLSAHRPFAYIIIIHLIPMLSSAFICFHLIPMLSSVFICFHPLSSRRHFVYSTFTSLYLLYIIINYHSALYQITTIKS
jgi:hypothetical protein